MPINNIMGTIGLILVLIAFILNLFKKITQDSKLYNLINFFGAGLLAYYSYSLGSIIFLILQLTWALFALYFLIRLITKK